MDGVEGGGNASRLKITFRNVYRDRQVLLSVIHDCNDMRVQAASFSAGTRPNIGKSGLKDSVLVSYTAMSCQSTTQDC